MTKMEAARRARGWTQTDLAYHARTAQSDISAFERHARRPYPALAGRLAEVLGLRAAELTDTADEPPKVAA